MIDWSKEVETTEDPPRPVRVLFNAEHLAAVGVIGDSEIIRTVRGGRIFDGEQWVNLRNVAPPKPEPVLREGWINLYADGGVQSFSTEEIAKKHTFKGRVECRRIAWMSDGSPVPGEAAGEEDPTRYGVCEVCVEKAVKSADEWRTKAEALERSEKTRDDWLHDAKRAWGVSDNVSFDDVWAECLGLRAKAEALQAEVDRQKPVVDAVVAYITGPESIVPLGNAIRAYLSKQAPAEPVKNCLTCRRNVGVCVAWETSTCVPPFWSMWEPRHE